MIKGSHQTKEAIAKMKKNMPDMSGKKNPFYGKKHKTKTKQKISKSRTGKCVGKDNPMYGSHRTGKDNPFYGHHHTTKNKKILGKSMKGKHHTLKTRNHLSKALSGKKNPMYGKKGTWAGKERPEQSKKLKGRKRPDLTKRLKEGLSVHASSFIKNPSKPQVALYKYIKKFYPKKEFGTDLNYPIEIRKDKHYSLDVAVPEVKVDYEYDGEYWHKDKEVEDFFRDENLMEKGWAVVRFKEKDLKKILKKKGKGSGWHLDRVRHSNARRFGKGMKK